MKINRYEYSCPDCFYQYVEQRRESDNQYFSNCHGCGAEYSLTNTTYVEDEVIPVIIIPEIIDEVIDEVTPE
jgi:peptide subunit release factor 1 (eRF1)